MAPSGRPRFVYSTKRHQADKLSPVKMMCWQWPFAHRDDYTSNLITPVRQNGGFRRGTNIVQLTATSVEMRQQSFRLKGPNRPEHLALEIAEVMHRRSG